MVDHIVDVESSIRRELNSLIQSPYNHCIRKVPEYISKVNKDFYEPSIVSIGPLHYNNPSLKPFHKTKLRHLQLLLKKGNPAYSLAQYIDLIRRREEEARSYYAEKIHFESDEFIKMVMVDSAFIVVLFIMRSSNTAPFDGIDDIDPMVNKSEVINQMNQDLLLEENQLPYFILQELYNKAFGESRANITFKDVTCDFMGGIGLPVREPVGTTGSEKIRTCKLEDQLSAAKKTGREKIKEASEIKHFVDFLRIWYLPTKVGDQNFKNSNDFFAIPPSATKLEAAGVKFVAGDSKHMLDIDFSNGVLRISPLILEEDTEAVLRNIMFFEQCCHPLDSYFSDYVTFLDDLIDCPKDVQILIENGIITNGLGSYEMAATFFDQIAKYVNWGSSYASVTTKLNAHVSKRWNRWMAVLRRDYFNHPWSIISLIYLVVLLILTIVQVYTGFVH